MSDRDLDRIAEDVAKKVLGKQSAAHSTPGKELRWGSNGSMSFDVKKRTFYAFDDEDGGGVLWLLEREKGLKGKDAFKWLRDNGFSLDDRKASDDQAAKGGKKPAPQPARAQRARPADAPVLSGERDVQRPAVPAHDEPAAQGPARAGGGATGQGGAPASGRWSFLNLPDDAELVKTYDFTDEQGALLFQVCRFQYTIEGKLKKSFRQRTPDKSKRDGWRWGAKGVRQVPYRLPEWIEAMASGAVGFLCEGEKDVDNLWALGIPATCNAGGAGKWPEELTPYFEGVDLVHLPDFDPQKRREKDGTPLYHDDGTPQLPGQDHTAMVIQQLAGVVKRQRVLELARTWEGMPWKGDVSDWIDAGGTADDLYFHVVKAVPAEDWIPSQLFSERSVPVDLSGSELGFVMWKDLGSQAKQHAMLVKKWLTQGEVAVMAGASQAGKTFAVVDIAFAVARGTMWMDKYRVNQGLVIYQAGEGAQGLVDLRIPAYNVANRLNCAENLPLAVTKKQINLAKSDEDCNKLIKDIKLAERVYGQKAALVVIDTASAATIGADENSAKEIGPVLERCYRIAHETGATVLLVAHMNASGEKVRGWTGFTANVDSVITCSLVPDQHDGNGRAIRELYLHKQKDGPNGLTEKFVLRSHEIGRDEDNEAVTSCTIEPPSSEFAEAAPRRSRDDQPRDAYPTLKVSDQCKILLACIDEAIGTHPVPMPSDARKLPRGVGGTHANEIKRLFAVKWGNDEADPAERQDALRQAWKRQTDKLQALGLIVRHGDYVWRTHLCPPRDSHGNVEATVVTPPRESTQVTDIDDL
jgi:hypothetical protein